MKPRKVEGSYSSPFFFSQRVGICSDNCPAPDEKALQFADSLFHSPWMNSKEPCHFSSFSSFFAISTTSPGSRVRWPISANATNNSWNTKQCFETTTQCFLNTTQYFWDTTQNYRNITQNYQNTTQNHWNTITNAELICDYTTYNPISQPLTRYAPTSIRICVERYWGGRYRAEVVRNMDVFFINAWTTQRSLM